MKTFLTLIVNIIFVQYFIIFELFQYKNLVKIHPPASLIQEVHHKRTVCIALSDNKK